MNRKLFVVLFVLSLFKTSASLAMSIITPELQNAIADMNPAAPSPVFGLELNYNGDLRGNGDVAGKIFCAHDTEFIRIQAELEYKNNMVKPNILTLPIQHKNSSHPNYAINKNLSNLINTSITVAGLICSKEIARRTPNPQQEQLHINNIDKEIERGNEIIKRLEMEDLI